MATNYTALTLQMNVLIATLASLQVQASLTASHAVALTGTWDNSGNLIERIQALTNQLGLISTELARVDTSLLS